MIVATVRKKSSDITYKIYNIIYIYIHVFLYRYDSLYLPSPTKTFINLGCTWKPETRGLQLAVGDDLLSRGRASCESNHLELLLAMVGSLSRSLREPHFPRPYHRAMTMGAMVNLVWFTGAPNLNTSGNAKKVDHSVVKAVVLLLMEEILHHLGCIKPCKYWDKLPINWCRISSINSSWEATYPSAKATVSC